MTEPSELGGISPAMGETNKLGGDERPVMEAMETASPQFGTWEYWLAEETGNLPGSEPSSLSSRIEISRGETSPGSGQDGGEPDWRTINLEP
jgi:hypothetical protein